MERAGTVQIDVKKRDLTAVSLYLLFVLSFFGAVIAGNSSGAGAPAIELTPERLHRFTDFYRDNFFSEFGIIFFNNLTAALLLIYFTPLVLRLYRFLGFLCPPGCRITRWDLVMMYGFPFFFIIKQGIVMGLGMAGFIARVGESAAAVFFGIFFPHLALEVLAICLAGALGFKVTGQALDALQALDGGRTNSGVGMPVLAVVGLIASAALLEVALTPRVFAFMMLD